MSGVMYKFYIPFSKGSITYHYGVFSNIIQWSEAFATPNLEKNQIPIIPELQNFVTENTQVFLRHVKKTCSNSFSLLIKYKYTSAIYRPISQ